MAGPRNNSNPFKKTQYQQPTIHTWVQQPNKATTSLILNTLARSHRINRIGGHKFAQYLSMVTTIISSAICYFLLVRSHKFLIPWFIYNEL
jgi:hypothetical protein